MSASENLKDIFGKLVGAYGDCDDAAKVFLTKKIKDSGKHLRIGVEDDLQWEESQIEGYIEFPTVIQSIEVFFGNELVYEVERWFGSEKVDSTHTGLGGRWQTIRVDDGGHDGIIELLEDFGHPVDEPDVPPWR